MEPASDSSARQRRLLLRVLSLFADASQRRNCEKVKAKKTG